MVLSKLILPISLTMFFVTLMNLECEIKSFATVPTKSESKTQALYYWFDANTGQYIGRMENTGCDHSSSEVCSNGYITVANPSNPVEPSSPPNIVEFGKR